MRQKSHFSPELPSLSNAPLLLLKCANFVLARDTKPAALRAEVSIHQNQVQHGQQQSRLPSLPCQDHLKG